MQSYPDLITLVEEGHRGRDSFYLFQDTYLSDPEAKFHFAILSNHAFHRVYYSDDHFRQISLEREHKRFDYFGKELMGRLLVRVALNRDWTTGGVWRINERTILLFELEDDAIAATEAGFGEYHEASFAERWLSRETSGKKPPPIS